MQAWYWFCMSTPSCYRQMAMHGGSGVWWRRGAGNLEMPAVTLIYAVFIDLCYHAATFYFFNTIHILKWMIVLRGL